MLPKNGNDKIVSLAPIKFELDQNFPNPFNPSTTINYTLPEQQFVELKVYDYLGREVAILVNGSQNAGKHSITFNASSLSSGIYFYKIISGKNIVTKKMLLLK